MDFIALDERVARVAGAAQEEFWKIVAREFLEAKTGDLDAVSVSNFNENCRRVVEQWVWMNVVPAKDKR